MYRLLTVFIVLLLTACGTANEPDAEPANGQAGENNTESEENTENKKNGSEGNGIVAGEMQLNVVSFMENKAVIELQNQTERVQELQFSSGQQYDMWITDEEGKQVFHWGEGKMFTQALKTLTIKQGETHTFEVAMPKLDPGTYKVRFKVTSKPPIEKTFKQTIE